MRIYETNNASKRMHANNVNFIFNNRRRRLDSLYCEEMCLFFTDLIKAHVPYQQ